MSFSRRAITRIPLLLGGLGLALLSGCFLFGGTVMRDYSGFDSYSFEQTPGLGFCGDTTSVFSAEITRAEGGAMTYAATVLVPTGKSNEACDDNFPTEFPTELGCMTPKAQAARMLTGPEAEQVTAAFSAVKVHRGPERICRTIAIDPCVIVRHNWDSSSHSDYVCGGDRLDDEQSGALKTLINSLNNN